MNPTNLSPETQTERITLRHGITVMLISVVCFSVNTLLLRYLSGDSRGIPTEVPLLFRAGIGIFVVFLFLKGRRPTRIKPVFREPLLILRGITGLLGTAAYYWTVPRLGAGQATLICNTYVIFASVIAVLVLGEKLTKTKLFWLALAFGGIAMLLGPGQNSLSFSFGKVEAVAVVGAVLAAWSVVLIRQLVADFSNGTIYLSQCIWIFLPLLFLAGAEVPGLEIQDLGLLVLAGFAAGFGQLAMNEGYRCLTVSVGASMQMLWPVVTTLGGWFLFDERLAVVQVVGACLILICIWRVSVRKS